MSQSDHSLGIWGSPGFLPALAPFEDSLNAFIHASLRVIFKIWDRSLGTLSELLEWRGSWADWSCVGDADRLIPKASRLQEKSKFRARDCVKCEPESNQR